MKRTAFLSVAVFAAAILAYAGFFRSEPVNAFAADNFSTETNLSQADMAGEYNFDKAHSAIGFRIKHMGLVEIPGYFRDFTGTVNYDPQNIGKSSVAFTAKMTSVDTGVSRRDDHLRTADFFDVAKFPDLTFKSTKVEKKGNNLMLTGDLTMHGVTKSVSFPFTVVGFLKDQRGGMKMGAVAETTISRKDFGVGKDDKLPNGAEALSDKITVVLNIEANMAAPKTDSTTTK